MLSPVDRFLCVINYKIIVRLQLTEVVEKLLEKLFSKPVLEGTI